MASKHQKRGPHRQQPVRSHAQGGGQARDGSGARGGAGSARALPPDGGASRDRSPASTSAPLYWECPGCGYLTTDAAVTRGDAPCEACKAGASDGAMRQFPPDRLRRLDERIRRYNNDGDPEVVVILSATFLESLLEDILARIMEARGADVRLIATVLDTQRSVGQRLGKLFPALTGTEFEDAAAELGFRDFPQRWRVLRAERNAFIHDSAFEGAVEALTDATAAEAMRLLDQAYRLFVLLNNRFVADTRGSHGG